LRNGGTVLKEIGWRENVKSREWNKMEHGLESPMNKGLGVKKKN